MRNASEKNSIPPTTPTQERDNSLDFLRGTAVFFMIVTHTFVIFYNGTKPYMDFWVWWGATICFTTFLFVFSVFYGLKLAKDSVNPQKELKRAATLFIAYYIFALWAHLFVEKYINATILWKIISFQYLPVYTEFIATFGFYSTLIVWLRRPLKKLLSHHTLFTGFAAFLLFSLAEFFYQKNFVHPILIFVKTHLVGHGDIHVFGLITYAPIVLLGLFWGHHVLLNPRKKQAALYVAVVNTIFLALSLLNPSNSWHRWPPSLLFLLFGVAYLFNVLQSYDAIKRLPILARYMQHIGQHAFVYYVFHLLILLPLSLLSYYNPTQPIWAIFALIINFVTTYFFIVVKRKKRSHLD